jgi:hypothetical protein
MSQSDQDPAHDWSALREACDALNRKIAASDLAEVPTEVATALLTTATMLYRALAQDEHRTVPAFDKAMPVTPTAVAVTVTSMLQAVQLNSFDLAMWFTGRPVEPNRN